jgi:integrase
LRFQDVRDLTWGQIHGDSLEIVQAKTKNAASLPLSKSAQAILVRRGGGQQGRIIDNSGRVFPFPRRSTVYKVLNTWAKRAGLGVSICFHTARHSFATLMVSQNVDIYTISKLLGHKDIATTQIYAKVLDEKKKEAIDRLPMIGV